MGRKRWEVWTEKVDSLLRRIDESSPGNVQQICLEKYIEKVLG